MQLVVSVFPGGGKSTICKNAEAYGLRQAHVSYDDRDGVGISLLAGPGVPVFDSDSSNFPKDNFPANYIEHIKGVLADYPDVVIMVSSHDNVRQAMTEANIPYTLVYPQRELKSEFLERYEERGSPEAFVNMMDNKWNDFIDSSESDPAPDHIILSEGDYLVDKIYDRIKEVVQSTGAEMPSRGGFESIGDIIRAPDGKTFDSSSTESMEEYRLHCAALAAATVPVVEETPLVPAETTAAIVDVNADAETVVAVAIPAEPVGDVAVGVVSSPEGEEVATLTAGTLEGGQPAVDASTVDDSAMGTENHVAVGGSVDAGEDRADLIEAKFDMQNDIDVLEGVIVIAKDEAHEGFESLADHGEIMVTAAADINQRYGASVEPTLDGMEGFLDVLKGAMTKIKETFKGKPNKEAAKIIKRQLAEAVKAADVYKSPKWLEENKFINVGKAKVSVPEIFKEATDAGDVKTIVNGIISRAESMHTKYLNNAKARLGNGTKVFNKFKNADGGKESVEDLKKAYPIEPSRLTGAESDSGLKEVALQTSKIDIPVLPKKAIPDVVAIMESLINFGDNLAIKNDAFIAGTVPEEDIYNSSFWESHTTSKEFGVLWDAVSYDAASELVDIQYAADDVIFDICKFLESWILNSVK